MINDYSYTNSITKENFNLNLSVDKVNIISGDVITFSISVKPNITNVPYDLLLSLPLKNGLTFQANSLTNNNIPINGDIELGIPITLFNDETTTLNFKALVTQVPDINPITLSARASFQDTLNFQTITSNYINIYFSQHYPILTLIKSSNKSVQSIDEELIYTSILNNTSDYDIFDIRFKDLIPEGLLVKNGTLEIDGLVVSGGNITTGINIGNLKKNQKKIVRYTVTISDSLSEKIFTTKSLITYAYETGYGRTNSICESNECRVRIESPSNSTMSYLETDTMINEKSIHFQSTPSINFIKYANNDGFVVGDTITYKINIENTSNIKILTVTVVDNIPQELQFIKSSVSINGVKYPNMNILNGINIGTLNPADSSLIEFQALANEVPLYNPILNKSVADYSYSLIPGDPPINSTIESNIVPVTISQSDIITNIFKTQDINYASLGDTITFSLQSTNNSTFIANSCDFIDYLDSKFSFVKGSVMVNGIQQPGSDIRNSVSVGDINPNQSILVQFKAVVNTLANTGDIIPNYGRLEYSFQPSPNSDIQVRGINSKTTNTQINSAIISGDGLTKKINKKSIAVGGVATYSIYLYNSGNVSADNIVLVDPINPGTSFVVGSVKVNNQVRPQANPQEGITIGSLGPNISTIIEFDVKADGTPEIDYIENQGILTFDYKKDPASASRAFVTEKTNITNLTIISIPIESGINGFYKRVDLSDCTVGDTVLYTVTLQNSSTVAANNVIVTDILDTSTTFIDGSVTVDGNPISSNPQFGINIGTILPLESKIIQFKVKVISVPINNFIKNSSMLNYNYTTSGEIISIDLISNTVETRVNYANISNTDGGLLLSQDTQFTTINSDIMYTCSLKNTGNTLARNIIFYDTIPKFTEFVHGSVFINGINKHFENPEASINIGELNSSEITTISYKVKVVTIPNSGAINNNCRVRYNFIVDNQSPDGKTVENTSNSVACSIREAIIDKNRGLHKQANTNYTIVGDFINYDITIQNVGNVDALNVIFTDTIATQTEFVPGSVSINGAILPSADVRSGVEIGVLPPQGSKVISFTVKVINFDASDIITNFGVVKYSYISDPTTEKLITKYSPTNTVSVKINEARISSSNNDLQKTVTSEYSSIGSILSYKISIRNSGTTSAENIEFIDKIPTGTEFIANSLTIDGETVPGGNPETGVKIGILGVNQIINVNFQVKVISIPESGEILNNSSVNYTYLINPDSGRIGGGSASSNVVKTKILQAMLNTTKTVDKSYAKIGDILSYTILMKNAGNTNANKIQVFDKIKDGTTLIEGTVKFNGNTVDASILNGKIIESLQPMGTGVISYSVRINKIPPENPLKNDASINYQYITNPISGSVIDVATKTNVVSTKINTAIINNPSGGFVKSQDKNFVSLNDIIQYKISLTNTGNVNASNIKLKDVFDNKVKYIQNSLIVNGNPTSGDIQSGISLADIKPSSSTTVIFKVLVTTLLNNTIPNTALLNYDYILNDSTGERVDETSTSNTVLAIIRDPQLSLRKSQSLDYLTPGHTVTYSLNVYSNGNISTTSATIYDTIPSGLQFIPGSVQLNGMSLPLANPITGIEIGSISPRSSITVTFNAIPTKHLSNESQKNNFILKYSFEIDDNGNLYNGDVLSNETSLVIKNADVSYESGSFIKYVDKQFASICDTVTYTFVLKNVGNTSANSVVLKDTIPNSLKYNEGSVIINGIPKKDFSPYIGIPVGSINLNETITVSFTGSVVSLPTPNVATNFGTVNYKYTVDPNYPNAASRTNKSNNVSTVINGADISNPAGFIKTVCQKTAKISDILEYKISVTNTGNVIAEEVILTDTLVPGLLYIDDSLIINGISKPLNNIQKGVPLGAIPPNQTVLVQFNALVVSIPNNFIAKNSAKISYKYLVNPLESLYCSSTNLSNTVETDVNIADISLGSGGFIKSVNKAYSDLNEVISYLITIKNKGNMPAINTIFKDTIPAGTKYIEDSFAVNGVILNNANPSLGVQLNTIPAGAELNLSFKVLVNSIVNNIVSNTGSIDYCYYVSSHNCNTTCPNCCVDPCGNCCRLVCDEGLTNTVNTEIKYGNIKLLKNVDKNYTTYNSTLTYTIDVINNGNVDLTNVFLQDTLSSGLFYIDNSLTINDKLALGENVQRGINLSLIKANDTVKVKFKALVYTIPSNDTIKNTAYSSYKYEIIPNSIISNKNTLSNTVTTTINYVLISNKYNTLNKYVNTNATDLGDILSYNIKIRNEGNTKAEKVIFTDSIPNGTTYVKDSLKLDGVAIVGGVPQTGVDIGTLEPNQSINLSFNVTVVTIPKNNLVLNKGSLNYRFTEDPSIPLGKIVYEETNMVSTQINHGEITNGFKQTPGSKPEGGFTKEANKKYAKIGDKITYTLYVSNSGNVAVTNVEVYDILKPELLFVKDSLAINDIPSPNSNPNTGILIDSIASGDKVKLTFDALVLSLPKNSIIKNKATLEYRYKVKDDMPPIIKTSQSNEENINVSCAIIKNMDGGFIKSADKTYVKLNDEITYTIIMKNTGNVVATDIIFKDQLQLGTVFVKDSLTINSNKKVGANPQVGVTIPNMDPKDTVVIKFKAKVVSVIPSGLIENVGEVLYKFRVDPNKPEVDDSSLTNTVKIKLNTVDFSGNNFKKIVSKNQVSLGELVTYTFAIRNNGNVNANNVILTDSLPEQVKFVEGSVLVDGNPLPSGDPRVGIGLASISPKETVTVSFNVETRGFLNEDIPIINIGKLYFENVVNPNDGPVNGTVLSNPGELYIRTATIEAIKIPLNKCSTIGDEIWYKVILKNIGNTTALGVEIYDNLPECLKFVENSVSIDGIDSSYSIISGIPIGDIKPNESIEVLFRTTILCMPSDCEIINTVKGTGCYFVSNSKPNVLFRFESNSSVVEVVNPEITVCKYADKEIAKYCDEIHFKVVLENTGVLKCFNIKLYDLLPEQLKLLGDTVFINGQKLNGVNLNHGINIGELNVGQKIEIYYTTIVIKSCSRKIIENKAFAEFKYQICSEFCPKLKKSNVATCKLQGVSASFQQISIDNIIKLPHRMPCIKDIVDVRGKVCITNHYVIETIKGYSAENRRVTGHKLVVNGKIFECLEYIAQEPTCTTHYQEAVDKFSTFIILAEDYKPGTTIEVVADIEDIHFEQIKDNEVFVSATISLDIITNC